MLFLILKLRRLNFILPVPCILLDVRIPGPNGLELQGPRMVLSPNCYLRFNGSLVHSVTVRQSDR